MFRAETLVKKHWKVLYICSSQKMSRHFQAFESCNGVLTVYAFLKKHNPQIRKTQIAQFYLFHANIYTIWRSSGRWKLYFFRNFPDLTIGDVTFIYLHATGLKIKILKDHVIDWWRKFQSRQAASQFSNHFQTYPNLRSTFDIIWAYSYNVNHNTYGH